MLLQATVSGSVYTVEGYSRALLGFSCCSYKATRTEIQEGEKKKERKDLNKIAQELRHLIGLGTFWEPTNSDTEN